MKDDLLREASRALRDASDVAPAPAQTRARVVSTLRERRKRRLELMRLVLPLAAILVASTSWAATTDRLRHVVSALGVGPDRPVVMAAANRAAPSLTEAASALAAAATAVPPAASAEPVPSAPEPSVAPSAKASASASPAKRIGLEDPPEIHALYTAAHTAHFGERNWPVALDRWNAYLAAAPRGQFAVEAHYNRALCLVRLGRTSEARAALETFARGGFGGYRRSEAQAVLDAIDGRSP